MHHCLVNDRQKMIRKKSKRLDSSPTLCKLQISSYVSFFLLAEDNNNSLPLGCSWLTGRNNNSLPRGVTSHVEKVRSPRMARPDRCIASTNHLTSRWRQSRNTNIKQLSKQVTILCDALRVRSPVWQWRQSWRTTRSFLMKYHSSLRWSMNYYWSCHCMQSICSNKCGVRSLLLEMLAGFACCGYDDLARRWFTIMACDDNKHTASFTHSF